MPPEPETAASDPYVRRHLRIGWWAILIFLTLGIVLEALHGLKVGWYLNTSNETRRHMWTLAHAHGVLVGVLHLGFAFSVRTASGGSQSWKRIASTCLSGATVLLPGGFLLGGIVIYGGDPGKGILLVPLGAAALFVAVLLTATRGLKS